MPVLPVEYVWRFGFRERGYVWVFKVVEAVPEAGFWNSSRGIQKKWGRGPNPVRMRYFAAEGIYFYRSDCARDANCFPAITLILTKENA